MASTPLLRHDDSSFTHDLTDQQVTDYFDFRTRLAFAILSEREFFTHRYVNSDNARLTIQAFTSERAGGAAVTSRRRDGSSTTLIPKGRLDVRRPEHVSGSCELPRDLDQELLHALEAAAKEGDVNWFPFSDALRLFVGGNTDSPDISQHTELIDIVSAFSRLSGAWDQRGTVEGFLAAFRPETEPDRRYFGGVASNKALSTAMRSGKSIREVWLGDAYVLRSQYGHGHVEAPPYSAIWTTREHLLLAAFAFPLFAKGVLAKAGYYELTADDVAKVEAFDTLATLKPFSGNPDNPNFPWRAALSRARQRPMVLVLAKAFEEAMQSEASRTTS
ncbi:MAG: hypothetical protein Q7S20_13030 [Gemmatimonadaceae bacterium]|nr:hypothetical protein [Gemmatimonadaceae bacterium]